MAWDLMPKTLPNAAGPPALEMASCNAASGADVPIAAQSKGSLPSLSSDTNVEESKSNFHSAPMETVGQRLRWAREQVGATQDAVGKAVGVKRAAVSQWESDQTTPDTDNLSKACEFLGVSAHWVLTGEGEPAYPQNSQLNDRSALRERKFVGETRGKGVALGPEAPHLTEQRDLPIRGYGKGGEGGYFFDQGEIAGYTMRPSILIGVADAYAFEMWDTSMEPALKHGFIQWVHPRKVIHAGDDVIVQLRDGGTIVKNLVRRTEKTLFLQQYNPPLPRPMEIPMKEVKACHLVIGGLRVRV